jgi:cell division protein FtsB
MDANQVVMLTPVLQYGFAGLCLVLIAVLAWLMNRVLQVLGRTSDVIAANTETIRTVEAAVKETEAAVHSVRDQLLRFTCPYEHERRPQPDQPSEAPHALAAT